MKRMFDLCLASLLLVVVMIPLACLALAVKLTSKGPIFYWSDRIGRGNRIFRMPKFRTMRIDSPEVATHLLTDPQRWLTPVGKFLRSTSLDELPQLWSILVGEITFVGPRPALHNQDDLIAWRTFKGVHQLLPGLTGWAQINGRDETPVPKKVELDAYYLENYSFWLDWKILVLTFSQVVRNQSTSVPSGIVGMDQGEHVPVEAYLASAATWIDQHDFERAISAYDQAVVMDPHHVVAINNRGTVWAAQREYQRAIDDFNSAIRLSSNFMIAYQNRGFVFAELGQINNSRNDFATASTLQSDLHINSEVLVSDHRDHFSDYYGALRITSFAQDIAGKPQNKVA